VSGYLWCLLVAILFCSAVHAADPNLLAWYKLDDGSGSSATDSSGNGHTGTLVNSPQWTSGIVGGALQFDGSSNYVTVPSSPDVGGGSFTLTAWINTTNSGVDQKFIDKWNDNSGNFQFSFQVFHDQHLWLSIRQTSGVEAIASGTTTISPNRWYHAAAVADAVAKTMTIYVNGVAETLQANPGWDGTVQSVAMEMNIGRKCSVFDYFKGRIDDARVYNRVLSQAEVQALVAAAPPAASADIYGTPLNTTLTVPAPGVLSNDNSTIGNPLTAIKVTSPVHGTLTLNADGSFVYVPQSGFTGIDNFTYKANDGISDSNTAQVTLGVGQLYQGLVAWWKLDDGSGNTAADSTGNGNAGALTGGASWSSGFIGGACQFDGNNGAIKVSESANLEPTSGITVAMWGKITNTLPTVGDLLRKAGPFNAGYLLRWNDGSNRLGWHIDSFTAAPLYVTDTQSNSAYVNGWHHFTGTYDSASGVANLYVDGVLHSSGSRAPAAMTHTDDLYLMFVAYGTQVAVPGLLDDVRVYNRALSASEVAVLGKAIVTDTNGVALDGEYNGASVPSGNGVAGGNYVANFTISTPKLNVTQLNPAPGATVTAVPGSIVATFSKDLDPATANLNTIVLTRAGSDGALGTGDDVTLTPASVSMTATNIMKIDLSGVTLPDDNYQIRLLGGATTHITDSMGNVLDGEYTGAFPSGNGTAGGDFVATFRLQRPPDLTPVISSPATATSDPAGPGDTVSFSISASSPDGATLTFVWDFGDGTQGTGSSTSHVYSSAGVYTVSVSVYGPSGASTTSTITVQVSAASAAPTLAMSVSKMTGSVDFSNHSHDSITVSGVIPGVAKGFVPAGVVFSIDVSGATQSFTLDSKGKSKTANGTLALKLPHSKQGFPGGSVPFSVKLINGAWAAGWNMAPSDAKSSTPVTLAVNVGFLGQEYATTVTVSYFPKTKNGKFKK
jgi:hypothetical protein